MTPLNKSNACSVRFAGQKAGSGAGTVCFTSCSLRVREDAPNSNFFYLNRVPENTPIVTRVQAQSLGLRTIGLNSPRDLKEGKNRMNKSWRSAGFMVSTEANSGGGAETMWLHRILCTPTINLQNMTRQTLQAGPAHQPAAHFQHIQPHL